MVLSWPVVFHLVFSTQQRVYNCSENELSLICGSAMSESGSVAALIISNADHKEILPYYVNSQYAGWGWVLVLVFFVFSRKPLLPLQNKTKKGNYIMIQLLAFFTQRNTNDSPALKSFKQKMQTISNSVSPSFNVDNWKKNLTKFLFYFGTILVLKSRNSRIYPSQILVWLYLAVVDIWALKLYYYKFVLFLVLVKSFHSSKEY